MPKTNLPQPSPTLNSGRSLTSVLELPPSSRAGSLPHEISTACMSCNRTQKSPRYLHGNGGFLMLRGLHLDLRP